jgi:hypothetical protein
VFTLCSPYCRIRLARRCIEGTWFCFHPEELEVLQRGRGWRRDLGGRRCWRGSSWWLAAAGYGSGPSGAHPGCPGSHMANRQQPPSLGPGATMQWCPCARPRSRSCGRAPVEPSSRGAGPDRVEKMTEPADIVTCQSCGAGSTEPEARKRGWVASEGRWACDNCLNSGRDSGSERDRLPPSG